MQLYIGNKNYSSWSLRPWLLMTHAGIPFEEKKVRLGWEDDSPFKKTMLSLAPSGRVPLLIDDGFPIWDSLAIAETLAERFPEKQLWPRDPKQRARAIHLYVYVYLVRFVLLSRPATRGRRSIRPMIPKSIAAIRPSGSANRLP